MVDLQKPLSCAEAVRLLGRCFEDSTDPYAATVPIACELIRQDYAELPELTYESRTKKDGPFESRKLPFLQYRLNVACLLACDLKAGAELVAASLLGPGIKVRLFFRNTLENRIGADAYKKIADLLRTVSNSGDDPAQAAEKVDALIWDAALEQQYQELLRKVRKNKTPQTYYIKQAYALARNVLEGIVRPNGEPYLFHPLSVAHLLADRGAESERIAAALFHDAHEVMEDSAERLGRFRKNMERISPRMARLVTATAAVDRAFRAYVASESAPEPPPARPDGKEAEQAAHGGLLQMPEGEGTAQAVYFMAADRVRLLLDADGMPAADRAAFLYETEEFYLPLFRAFGIHEFIPTVEDQLWKARDGAAYRTVADEYERLLRINRRNLQDTQELLSRIAAQGIGRKCEELGQPCFFTELKKEELRPVQAYRAVGGKGRKDLLRAVNKYAVPLLRVSLVAGGRQDNAGLNGFVSAFVKALEDETEDLKHVITSIRTEPISAAGGDRRRVRIVLENEMASRAEVFLYDQEDYSLYKNGSSEGVVLPERGGDIEILEGSVKVRRRDDSVMVLPKGATALDFAFAIHEDVGYTAAKASINDRPPTAEARYYELRDDDKVVIYNADGEIGGYGDPQFEIEWLIHVETRFAKKKILQRLQNKYESPKGEK